MSIGAALHHYWEEHRKATLVQDSKDKWKKSAKKKEAQTRHFIRNNLSLIQQGKRAALCFPGIVLLTAAYTIILCTSVHMGWV